LRKELKPTGEMVLGRVYANRFERKAGGRKAGQENVNSHYRKGKRNDWVHHFSPDHIRYFRSRFGDVVTRLVYEESPAMAYGSGGTDSTSGGRSHEHPLRHTAVSPLHRRRRDADAARGEGARQAPPRSRGSREFRDEAGADTSACPLRQPFNACV